MLNDLHIDEFAKMIPSMRMQPTIFLQMLNNVENRSSNEEFVQILFSGRSDEGHWICMWYDTRILHVYDSIGAGLHDDHLRYLNRIFPQKDYLEVVNEKV